MYLKISTSDSNLLKSPELFSSKLFVEENIKSIEVIDKENLLILIENGNDVKGAIYNIKKNEIIRFIGR